MKPRELLAYLMDRKRENPNSLSKKIGVPQPTIARFVSGDAKAPQTKTLEPIAKHYGIPIEALLNERAANAAYASLQQSSLMDSPDGGVATWNTSEEVEGRIWVDRADYHFSAGDGHIQWEVRQKQALPFSVEFFKAIRSKPDNCRLVNVRGNSMEPFLFDRDMMMVDTSKTDIKDGLIYALYFSGEAWVKQVFKTPTGLILHSFNEKYPDRELVGDSVADLKVIGEVVYRSGSGFFS